MWIVASIPFWIIATVTGFAGLICLIGPFFFEHDEIQEDKFKGLIRGGFVMLICSGGFALIAAKICS